VEPKHPKKRPSETNFRTALRRYLLFMTGKNGNGKKNLAVTGCLVQGLLRGRNPHNSGDKRTGMPGTL
jgi:hypothetical protein